MSKLFEKLKLRGVESRNRIWVSPMCQYSSENGMPTDWTDGGWDLEQSIEFCKQSIEFCKQLKEIGIDLIDVSTGGNVPNAKIPVAPGYQVSFAAEISKQVGIKTAAVGMITEPKQAEEILARGEADAVLLAREFLREPYFVFRAAQELSGEARVPKQYGRAIDLRKAKSA